MRLVNTATGSSASDTHRGRRRPACKHVLCRAISSWSLGDHGDRSSARCKITRITWNRKSAYGLIKVQILQWSTGRRIMNLHLYEMWQMLCRYYTKILSTNTAIYKANLDNIENCQQSEAFRSGLSRLKIISRFLFRCQKRSSNWIIDMILLYLYSHTFSHIQSWLSGFIDM